MVQITESYIPVSNANRPGSYMNPTYITIHNTGNSSRGADAKANNSYMKSESAEKAQTSWHYTVDDKSIYHGIPDNEIAWHAGSRTGNYNSIGIEICMNLDGDITKATDNAAELTAYLCNKHSIPLSNVVQHNYWSGKDCPLMIRRGIPYDWSTFISKVEYYKNKITDYSNISNIISELANRGVMTDTDLWNKLLVKDSNLYWLARKACEQTVKYERKNKLSTVNDIVWELGSWGIMTDTDLWLSKLESDTNAYWLAYKICNLCKGV